MGVVQVLRPENVAAYFGFEGNRRTAMDLLLGWYRFPRVRGQGFPFLGLGWLPE